MKEKIRRFLLLDALSSFTVRRTIGNFFLLITIGYASDMGGNIHTLHAAIFALLMFLLARSFWIGLLATAPAYDAIGGYTVIASFYGILLRLIVLYLEHEDIEERKRVEKKLKEADECAEKLDRCEQVKRDYWEYRRKVEDFIKRYTVEIDGKYIFAVDLSNPNGFIKDSRKVSSGDHN